MKGLTIKLALLQLILLPGLSAGKEGKIPKDIDVIDKQEKWGLVQYNRGNYKEAFEELSELATWGYKDPQYAMALMFLKGQYVQQSTLIGVGWLAVAAESKQEEWQALLDKIYAASSPEQQQRFARITADYKTKFGMKAQHVTCHKRVKSPSRKIIIDCTKDDYLIIEHKVDLTEADLNY